LYSGTPRHPARHTSSERPESEQLNEHSSKLRKWLLVAAKLLIVVLVGWAISGTIIRAWHELHKPEFTQRQWSIRPGWLVVAGLLYLAGLLPEGLFWHRALHALGQDVPLGRTLRAYYIGHLGKYVPGKAMVVVIRTGMICGKGVDTGIATASVFLETLTMMAVGAFLSAAILVFCYVQHGMLGSAGNAQLPEAWQQGVLGWFATHGLLLWVALALLVVAGLPTLPPVFSRLSRLAGLGRSNPDIAAKLAQLRYGTLLWGWCLMLVGWVLMGASLWAVLKAIGAENADLFGQLHLDTAAVAMATVAGFVSFIPGGAVVREVVLALLVAPQVGDLMALLSAVVLRLVWLVSELVISAILYLCRRSVAT
jgi:uncharacterized membrane protein YbhN (UPF0104 family)